MFISVNMIHLVFSPPGFPARSAACIDGRTDGRVILMQKNHVFGNFSKTTQYFFLAVSRPLKRVLKTVSEKNSKKIRKFNFFLNY